MWRSPDNWGCLTTQSESTFIGMAWQMRPATNLFIFLLAFLSACSCAAPRAPVMRTPFPRCPPCEAPECDACDPCPEKSGHDGPISCPKCRSCPPPAGSVRLRVFNPYRAEVRIELKCRRYRRTTVVPPKGSAVLRIPRRARRCEAWPKVNLWP